MRNWISAALILLALAPAQAEVILVPGKVSPSNPVDTFSGDFNVTGDINSSGTITADFFVGDGSLLTGVGSSTESVANTAQLLQVAIDTTTLALSALSTQTVAGTTFTWTAPQTHQASSTWNAPVEINNSAFTVSGASTTLSVTTIAGVTFFGAKTVAQIRALACPVLPCVVHSSDGDFGIYRATFTVAGDWKNERGTGP